jgi:septin family protein
MEIITANIKFQCPFGAMVSGPSMSGKSTLIFNMLNNTELVFSPIPQRIVYVYGAWQDNFNNFNNVEFISSLAKVLEEDFFDPKINNLLVLDDLMEEISSNPKASRLFTKSIHHKNLSVLFLVQNLFRQGKAMRDIALNCQYIILFKNNRDVNQIKLLSRQLGLSHMVQAYACAIKEPYGYLLIDLHPKTPDILKLQ